VPLAGVSPSSFSLLFSLDFVYGDSQLSIAETRERTRLFLFCTAVIGKCAQYLSDIVAGGKKSLRQHIGFVDLTFTPPIALIRL
jgi:hypothetical protein